ncbi:MAG: hypothetical protein M1812_000545 [Candelaria pacifica]|nr:MAG: hypothetical protein M1812_000545 [Candelaria pacifica]
MSLTYNNLIIAQLKEECKKRGLLVGGTKDILVGRLEDSDERIAAGDTSVPAKPKRQPRRKPFPFMKFPPEIQVNILDMAIEEDPLDHYEIPSRLPAIFSKRRIAGENKITDSAVFEYVLDPRKSKHTYELQARKDFRRHILKKLRNSNELSSLWMHSINKVAVMEFNMMAGSRSRKEQREASLYDVLLLNRITNRRTAKPRRMSNDPNDADQESPKTNASSKAQLTVAPILISEHRQVRLAFYGPRYSEEKSSKGVAVWAATLRNQVDNLTHHVLRHATKLQCLIFNFTAVLADHEDTIELRHKHLDAILEPLEVLRDLREVRFEEEQERFEGDQCYMPRKYFTDEYIEHFTKLVTSPAPKEPPIVQQRTFEKTLPNSGEGATLIGEDSPMLDDGSTLIGEGTSIFGGGPIEEGAPLIGEDSPMLDD